MDDHPRCPGQGNDLQNGPSTLRQVLMATLFIVAVATTATLGSLATTAHTDGWYAKVEKIAWNPPNEVFGPAWTVLYLLIVIAGFLLWKSGYVGGGRPNQSAAALRVFALQLSLNLLWTPMFFAGFPLIGKSAWWVSLVIILALVAAVVWLIVLTNKRSRVATILLLPYLLWIIFASTLNAGIIVLN